MSIQWSHAIDEKDNKLEILSIFGKFDWLVVFSHKKVILSFECIIWKLARNLNLTRTVISSNCNQYFTRIYIEIIRYFAYNENIILGHEKFLSLCIQLLSVSKNYFLKNKNSMSFIFFKHVQNNNSMKLYHNQKWSFYQYNETKPFQCLPASKREIISERLFSSCIQETT